MSRLDKAAVFSLERLKNFVGLTTAYRLLLHLSRILLPSSIRFSSSLLSFVVVVTRARIAIFFCGYLAKKHDVMESFMYVGVQIWVYSKWHWHISTYFHENWKQRETMSDMWINENVMIMFNYLLLIFDDGWTGGMRLFLCLLDMVVFTKEQSGTKEEKIVSGSMSMEKKKNRCCQYYYHCPHHECWRFFRLSFSLLSLSLFLSR